MILETSEAMCALAELYDVPELAHFSSEITTTSSALRTV
jgi:hypothetical protein